MKNRFPSITRVCDMDKFRQGMERKRIVVNNNHFVHLRLRSPADEEVDQHDKFVMQICEEYPGFIESVEYMNLLNRLHARKPAPTPPPIPMNTTA